MDLVELILRGADIWVSEDSWMETDPTLGAGYAPGMGRGFGNGFGHPPIQRGETVGLYMAGEGDGCGNGWGSGPGAGVTGDVMYYPGAGDLGEYLWIW